MMPAVLRNLKKHNQRGYRFHKVKANEHEDYDPVHLVSFKGIFQGVTSNIYMCFLY